VIAFRKPDAHQARDNGNGTFDFLGLPHYWTRSRRGLWVIKRRTARKRLQRTKKALWRWCRTNPSCAPAIPVSDAVREATRALSRRRYAGQLPSAGERPSLCGEGVVILVESA
jgi:hypothetical protein